MYPERPRFFPLDASAQLELRARLGLPPWGMRCEGEDKDRQRPAVFGADAARGRLPGLQHVLLTPAGRAVYNTVNCEASPKHVGSQGTAPRLPHDPGCVT